MYNYSMMNFYQNQQNPQQPAPMDTQALVRKAMLPPAQPMPGDYVQPFAPGEDDMIARMAAKSQQKNNGGFMSKATDGQSSAYWKNGE